MRYLPAISLLAATASARNKWASIDTDFATEPPKTADWYEQNDLPLPKVAPAINTVMPGNSYIVKLDCAGCPFRVRPHYPDIRETWQEPAQESSLLLNFTIDATANTLYLNDERIAPIAAMPLYISAFQTPANLSLDTMDKMAKSHMLSHDWHMGTIFGRYQLEYEVALVSTGEYGQMWFQFDVRGIHMLSGSNQGSYKLERDEQKIVQISVREEALTGDFIMDSVAVVAREDRVQPIKMKHCGRYAIRTASFRPQDWDYYGKIGTSERIWHMIAWTWLSPEGLAKIALFIVFALVVRRFVLRRQMKADMRDMQPEELDEAEAALLGVSYSHGDAPPQYAEADRKVGANGYPVEKTPVKN